MSIPKKYFHINSPLIESKELDKYINATDKKRRVLLKMDALQPSGSFKIRGIGYKCAKAVIDEKCTRLVSSSGGNAGKISRFKELFEL
jgi:L-serine/L-threonine ammonia-lyase